MKNPKRPLPIVAVLLCTYNGEAYLSRQLESIASQSHRSLELWVSDDGSTDSTLAILHLFQVSHPGITVHVVNGPQRGVGANFMSIVCNPEIQADFYAYCDQDDVWFENKLSRAIHALVDLGTSKPALYCATTTLIDSVGRIIGQSPVQKIAPSFQHALSQNLASGNTMVFNHHAARLLRAVGAQAPVVLHDWLTYLAVAATNGYIVYDTRPALFYRQHAHNIVGISSGWKDRITRILRVYEGCFRAWSDIHLKFLNLLSEKTGSIDKKNLETVFWFQQVHQGANPITRLKALAKSGIYRQSKLSTLSLWVAVLFKKI